MKAEIEAYLLTRRTWVSATALSLRFHVPERKFRQARGKPGLLSEFAISDTVLGYKHLAQATTKEWLHHKHSKRRHAIMEMVRTREQDKKRQAMRRVSPPVVYEKDSNQTVMTWQEERSKKIDFVIKMTRDAWTPDAALRGDGGGVGGDEKGGAK